MPLDIEGARSTLSEAKHHDASPLRERIEALATPRMSGSEGAEATEAALREAMEDAGYETAELPFSFSAWPGRFGLPLAGLLLAATGAGAAATLAADLPALALVILVVGLALALLPLLLLGTALRSVPWGRVETHNLLFTRPGTRPSWLVMAHRDSKAQPIPTLVRTGAVGLGAAGWLALIVLSGLWFAGDPFRFSTATWIAGGAVVLAGLILVLGWSYDGSPGALDNATGLAALLAVASSDPAGEVGFLVTDGEEMGLAGARAAATSIPVVQGVINLDGLDDQGRIYVMEGHGWRREGTAPQLAAALLTAGEVLGIDVRRRRLPRSILVDHLPIAAAGIPAVSILRGRWRSLLRVHRAGDSADRLDGRGAAEVATVTGAALRLLREAEGPHLASE